MDIDYDPSEIDEDELPQGLLDFRSGTWRLLCEEHGLVHQGLDGSAEAHDDLIYRWVDHNRERHDPTAALGPDDIAMLILPRRG